MREENRAGASEENMWNKRHEDDRVRWDMKISETTRCHPLQAKRESKYFFFCCPGLDLWSVGRTREEAEKRIKEEMHLLISRCSRYPEFNKDLCHCHLSALEINA